MTIREDKEHIFTVREIAMSFKYMSRPSLLVYRESLYSSQHLSFSTTSYISLVYQINSSKIHLVLLQKSYWHNKHSNCNSNNTNHSKDNSIHLVVLLWSQNLSKTCYTFEHCECWIKINRQALMGNFKPTSHMWIRLN